MHTLSRGVRRFRVRKRRLLTETFYRRVSRLKKRLCMRGMRKRLRSSPTCGRRSVRCRIRRWLVEVVFVKAPSFSIKALRTLIRTKRRMYLMIDRPSGPGKHNGRVRPAPIGRTTVGRKVPICRPGGVHSPRYTRRLEGCGTSIVIIVTFNRVVPGRVLRVAPCKYVGMRTSLLPGCHKTTPVR